MKSLTDWLINRASEVTYGRIIRICTKGKKHIFFVNIGAQDGISNDPLHKHVLEKEWSGIFVEPVKHVYDKLVANYKGRKNLVFENVAITQENGFKDFFYINQEGSHFAEWADQIGSFHLDHLLTKKKEFPRIEEYIVSEKMPCLTLNSLLAKHGQKDIDLLQIDAEGCDYEIIKSLDFSAHRPRVLRYEQTHLNEIERKDCIRYLKGKGYRVIWFGIDSIACLIPSRGSFGFIIKLFFIFAPFCIGGWIYIKMRNTLKNIWLNLRKTNAHEEDK